MKKDLLINGKGLEAKEYTSLYAPYSREEIGKISSADESEVGLEHTKEPTNACSFVVIISPLCNLQ
ncbi:hypothetical protein AB685_22135 [Bacillus sp. LL01]|uniref:hypothetical protein n=1 Tax=Bacillus sp. LL01 TaxID=1665556 RepID=UPI00064CF1D3|nr:hypothetical protein [Bacillus sp. LL01]KMJ56405.1 hypothetical protein AB685_22135 [Bacillus sp. LL01]